MVELDLVRDRWHWTQCGMCNYLKGTKRYGIGELELDLCDRCKGKINEILKNVPNQSIFKFR